MKVFAIDTSTPKVVACYFDDKSKIFIELETSAKHGTQVGQVAQMMRGVDFAALDVVCVGIGPGGLTGLRVGVSFATALGLGKKFVPINSLELIAYNAAFFDGYVVVVRKAREGYVYGGVFRANGEGELEEVEKPFITDASSLAEKLEKFSPSVTLGDAAPLFSSRSEPSEWDFPSARTLYLVARRGIAAENFVGLVEPLYLQKSIAELNFEKRARGEGR